MANLPVPAGLDDLLREIADGLGEAARILPEASRSAVGAVAVKRATVEIDFEMTTSLRRSDGSMGLGVRTFLIGAGVRSSDEEARARNSGRIALEIVAIAPAEEAPAKKGEDDPLRNIDPAQVLALVKQLRGEIEARRAAGLIDARVAAEAERLVDEAERRATAGDLPGAAERLKLAAQMIGMGR